MCRKWCNQRSAKPSAKENNNWVHKHITKNRRPKLVSASGQDIQKFFESGFQKARFWTLDDESRAEKFSGGGVNLPDFSHVGARGVWLNVQREFHPGKKICSGVSKNADFRHL